MGAIADACSRGELPAEVVLVLSNVRDAGVLANAAARALPHSCVPHTDYPDRGSFEAAMLRELRNTDVHLVVLAGFMRILTPDFIREYYGLLLNVHPSLLPKYPGLNTHQRAIEAGDREAGATIHFVTPELDAGPPIIQARVAVLPDDSADTLARRVLHVEHEIYPMALDWCLRGRVELRDGRAWKDGAFLDESGIVHVPGAIQSTPS